MPSQLGKLLPNGVQSNRVIGIIDGVCSESADISLRSGLVLVSRTPVTAFTRELWSLGADDVG